MKKQLKSIPEQLLLLVKGMLFGTTISLAPLALIYHRQGWLFFHNLDWSLKGFITLCFASSIIFCLRRPQLLLKKSILIGLSIYLFFYTACCALCQRLGWTLILAQTSNQISPISFTTPIPIMILGWFLIALATVLQLAKPSRLSWLIFLSGIPLSFGVWFPLIALPGAWVVMKWLD